MFTLFAVIASTMLTPGSPPKTGEELIRDMHRRYAGKWYSNLTFTQKTTHPNGTVETWYEALKLPGFLRIDIAPLDSGKAIIFRNDSIYQLNGGKIQSSAPLIHPLMVLGFDVYLDMPERTIEKLQRLQFDLSKIHTDVWQGKPVYVVGADSGDVTRPQFWVDQKELLFVRTLRPNQQGGVNETQFNKYVKLGDAWLSPEVLFFTNGQPGTKEEYSDWKVGTKFDEG
ncbi:MAG: hypothetical protein HY700_21035, partial [Gemmatimonadetes bacterium]|nr:hypothetical protein [Gemmatimonadota bacterium]